MYTGLPSALESAEPLAPMKEVCDVGCGPSSLRGMGMEKYYYIEFLDRFIIGMLYHSVFSSLPQDSSIQSTN